MTHFAMFDDVFKQFATTDVFHHHEDIGRSANHLVSTEHHRAALKVSLTLSSAIDLGPRHCSTTLEDFSPPANICT